MERVMIFIDGSNLFWGVRTRTSDAKIDFVKLRDMLAKGRRVVRTYYYGSYDGRNPKLANEQLRFFEALERKSFDVVTAPLRIREQRVVEKGADVSLAIDMVVHCLRDAYDVAILVSGDDDFLRAVDEVKRAGKNIEVCGFPFMTGRKLRNSADIFVDLSTCFDDVKYQPKNI